ncbi:hypothetical protein G6F57_005906 [Rhizopus arrhizus]|uniref:Uncharacterized protein n=1 Tax=Rhizopus oryzae TaxID=64495 RepID=A0A9P7BXX2_RHIOR|nr:hypothetical protein G6F23_004469 [Rhizopus arrhizus]KAG1403927.1 hypothetical protein G6F58_010278 [Rhizopus delemar]KAG0764053.1 hypothetical protein G6F24_005528 [Rhizopus arrhizus]KAG0784243.1 hypothetical protein G6F22_008386 [Rhizopus arrhizus]KAG0791830.1 hypothetical protein G6F21_004795 [Rhizopus arrhizus]
MQSVRKRARLRSPSISSVQTEDYKKLKIEAQILYECMLLMTEKLEETVDVYAPTLHEKTRMLIKKELREWITSFFKTVITNVNLLGSDEVDLFEGIEEPFDEDLEKKANDLENEFYSLLENRIRQRCIARDQLAQVGQQLEENSREPDALSTLEPQPKSDINWNEMERVLDEMTEYMSSIEDELAHLVKEYKEIETIV